LVPLTSPDGITWTNNDIAINNPADIIWNGSQFVAVGAGGATTSVDGTTWQQTGVGVVAFALVWNGQNLLACGMGNCYTSSDGNMWVGGMPLPGVNPT
jgi:hypothetical protein